MILITIGEIITILGFLVILITALSFISADLFKQHVCKHDGGVNETRACDAICRLCGKNLGFIGTEENKKRAGRV